MNWTDWYTDLVDVYRTRDIMDGDLTRHDRVKVLSAIPCRIYQSDNKAIRMNQAAADIHQEDKLACDISVNIQAGDELLITRGARLGKTGAAIRAFAADPNFYYEPFGAVIPGLAHQEIRLMQQERVKGGISDDAVRADATARSDAGKDGK